MEYIELNKIPNYDFNVVGTLTGIIDNKIILGGGSGFLTPLSESGNKILNNTIKLLSLENNEWIINDEIEVELNYSKYGFCNGASIIVDENTIYYFGGLKFYNDEISNSKNIIEIKVFDGKISYKIYENILPFEGESTGIFHQGFGYVLCGGNLYKINFNSFINNKNQFNFLKIKINENLNGSLLFSNSKNIYLLGGYKPYDINSVSDSNLFYETRIIKITNNIAYKSRIKNFDKNPPVFLGSSSIMISNDKVMIVGGVNKDVFIDAMNNLSILENDELEIYKNKYFNMSENEFNFNKEIFLLDLNNFKIESLGMINHGLAGNPALVHYDNDIYILNGETKLGGRLVKPIRLIY